MPLRPDARDACISWNRSVLISISIVQHIITIINTLKTEHNWLHFAEENLKFFFTNKNYGIFIQILLKIVPRMFNCR